MEFDLKRQVRQLSLNPQAKACENKPRLKSRLHYCPYAITVEQKITGTLERKVMVLLSHLCFGP